MSLKLFGEDGDKAVIPEWMPLEAWNAFVDMRKKMKTPLTEYAKKLAIKELSKLAGTTAQAEEILNQSILKCWRGLFPLPSNVGHNNGSGEKEDGVQKLARQEREYREKKEKDRTCRK